MWSLQLPGETALIEWPALGALLLGMIAIAVGLLQHTSRWPGASWLYQNPDLPTYLRAPPLSLVPLGLMFVLMVAGGLVINRPGAGWGAVGLALFFLSLLSAIAALAMMARPPAWAKPNWHPEDRGDSLPTDRVGRRRRSGPHVRLPRPVYRLGWLSAMVVLVLWWLLAWPAAVLTGFGIAISFLVAMRPRDTQASPP